MQKLELDNRIALYGTKKEIDSAEQLIISQLQELPQMDERQARLALQRLIDSKKIKASILFEGNSVWSYDRVIRDIRKVVKNGMNSMTDYLYKWLTLSAGSIAHYSLSGWVETYPTIQHLKQFFKCNEFGSRVLTHIPAWKTDTIRIVEEIEHILEI